MMKSTDKYLSRYAEPETALAQQLVRAVPHRASWQYCLVIPAYKESPVFYQRLATTLLKQQAVLLILVINQPDNLGGAHSDNTVLWQSLIDASSEGQSLGNLLLRDIPATNSALLLVERFRPTRQIPEKQGVGLARKIGADIALALINSGHLGSPWIYTSDADAHLPDTYFSALDNAISVRGETQPAAAIYPFKHLCDDTAIGQATQLYEQRMLQYVAGLHSARSPYAFQTIGSAIAVAASHYAQVRGFPKRSGGEDFYLLNKLAKTGAIKQLSAPQITIDARQSDRVPFGTGPAISQLLRQDNLSEAAIFYHPQVFIALKNWLGAIAPSQTQPLDDLGLPASTLAALQAIGAPQAIAAALKVSTSTSHYCKHLNTWFDAFKTLKFIHHLRDHAHPSVNLQQTRGHSRG
ncbi:hypothetical protein A9Q89_09290 [Gammaproteobacteria bacterium 53_120_T64]|nr:hypothetical protein A9Q89_09290 [Gammaproteobacteria bacterium 53_120_T64]